MHPIAVAADDPPALVREGERDPGATLAGVPLCALEPLGRQAGAGIPRNANAFPPSSETREAALGADSALARPNDKIKATQATNPALTNPLKRCATIGSG